MAGSLLNLWRTTFSTVAKKMLNSSGDSTHPCRSPCSTSNQSDQTPSSGRTQTSSHPIVEYRIRYGLQKLYSNQDKSDVSLRSKKIAVLLDQYVRLSLLSTDHSSTAVGCSTIPSGRLGGSVGNLETFRRWDVSSNLSVVTRTGIFPDKNKIK